MIFSIMVMKLVVIISINKIIIIIIIIKIIVTMKQGPKITKLLVN